MDRLEFRRRNSYVYLYDIHVEYSRMIVYFFPYVYSDYPTGEDRKNEIFHM